jgi:hypothetical protein
MKSTMLSLVKFHCDKPGCLFECWINRNNNPETHYRPDMPTVDWLCPECSEGHLRYAPANARFDFELRKHPRQDEEPAAAEGEGPAAEATPDPS